MDDLLDRCLSGNRPLGRALRWPLGLLPSSLTLPILSGPARGCRWRLGSTMRRAWVGVYDRAILAAVLPHIPLGSVVFDLGAHAGYYTLARLSKAGHVYAFEPNPSDLTQHVAMNHLESRVTIYPVAVGAQSGSGFLSQDDDPSVRHIAFAGDPVRIVALDDIDLPDPVFIKMDIEGAEEEALLGMAKLIQRARPPADRLPRRRRQTAYSRVAFRAAVRDEIGQTARHTARTSH
ncbi:MAG: FkbM family methyltransferase [Vicinamibacterales bacterium]|jgi:FkbM family methyltransferase